MITKTILILYDACFLVLSILLITHNIWWLCFHWDELGSAHEFHGYDYSFIVINWNYFSIYYHSGLVATPFGRGVAIYSTTSCSLQLFEGQKIRVNKA